MNDKERLKEIKEHYNKHFHIYETFSTIENINWLIEQAERFDVLAEQHDEALMKNKRYQESIEQIELKIKNNDKRIERLSSEPQFYDRTKQIESLCGETLGLEKALEIIKEELEGEE